MPAWPFSCAKKRQTVEGCECSRPRPSQIARIEEIISLFFGHQIVRFCFALLDGFRGFSFCGADGRRAALASAGRGRGACLTFDLRGVAIEQDDLCSGAAPHHHQGGDMHAWVRGGDTTTTTTDTNTNTALMGTAHKPQSIAGAAWGHADVWGGTVRVRVRAHACVHACVPDCVCACLRAVYGGGGGGGR